jgi:hypothetical protein
MAGTSLSDADVFRLVDEMYALARIAVTIHERDSAQSDNAVLRVLPSEDRQTFDKRAAMLEFDAGMTRTDAAQTALASRQPGSRRKRSGSKQS